MYGIDISNHQRNIDLSLGSYAFCIIKATEGIGFTDPSFDKFVDKTTALQKLIGVYHFARPDLHRAQFEMRNEAEWFVKVISNKGLIGRSILVLDWEREPFNDEELVTCWVDKVIELTGVTPFIYGSRSKLSKWTKWEVFNKCPLWMALWPTTAKATAGHSIASNMPSKEIIPWRIWQYSSTGRLVARDDIAVDLDYCDMSYEEWTQAAAPKGSKEVISQYMQWAIDNGLIVGDGTGNYNPTRNLTREQAAILLYKFHEKFYK